MIEYRTFLNTDPPALAEIWNDAFSGRGSVKFSGASPLETFVFAKPYFDPAGLIVAHEEGRQVGFAHVGFGPNAEQSALCTKSGVICLLGVRATYRRRGIGSELLRRCEAYLTERGAQRVFAGPQAPFDPFYFGLYGGAGLPGFLVSDPNAEPFFVQRGYQSENAVALFQRRLAKQPTLADARFAALRKRYEVVASPPLQAETWWREGVMGPIDWLEFRLEDKSSGEVAAKASVWEMEGFRWRWNEPVVGIFELEVQQALRRQGLAKFLLLQILRHVQEQYFTLAEIQVPQSNAACIALLQGLQFEQVDMGQRFLKEINTTSPRTTTSPGTAVPGPLATPAQGPQSLGLGDTIFLPDQVG